MAVSFERYGRLYYLNPGDVDYSVGDRVLVPTESGPEVAECVWAPERVEDEGFEGLPVCDTGTILGLELLAHLLHFAEHTQQIAAQDLAAIFSGVSALHEGFSNLWETDRGVKPFRELAADSIEI